MKLIVGLGNPGNKYDKTRHNIGFYFIDSYARKHDVDKWSEEKNALVTAFKYKNEKIILLKPQSYMNLSGSVIKEFVDYYKISIDDLIIISDDLDLPVGKYRLRKKGSSGGHNGLKDIEKYLNTDEYKRLKIGIYNNDAMLKSEDTKDYVLSTISKDDMKIYNEMCDTINQILDSFLEDPFDYLMSNYNHK